MGLSSESACASLSSVHSKSSLRISERTLREISAENGEEGAETQRMNTKELLKQCLAQVVQQISLFNETLKQTKKNGSTPTHVTQASTGFGPAKPAKKRGRPPGSKNKAALSIPSFHDLHSGTELHLRSPSAAAHDTDSLDADGTHTDASGAMGDDGGRVHSSHAGEASSVLSDESEDAAATHISYEDRLKSLNNKYEVVQDPGKPVVFLVWKILEMLGKGPAAEKVLRSTVLETCKDAGIKTSGRTTPGSATGFDFNLAVSVMKGVQLMCEREDPATPEVATSLTSTDTKQPPQKAQEAKATLAQKLHARCPEVIDAFNLALSNKRAEQAAQAVAASAAGSSAPPSSTSSKDAATSSTTDTKAAPPANPFSPPLGLPLTPVDWQLSLLDPQALSQMMQWVQQVSRHADQYLSPRASDSRIPPGLDALLGIKDSSLHTDLVVEELLRQMTLPLSMPAAPFDPALLASVAEAQHALQQQQLQQTAANRRTGAAPAASSSDTKAGAASSPAVSSSSSSTEEGPNKTTATQRSTSNGAVATVEPKLSPKPELVNQSSASSSSGAVSGATADHSSSRKRALRSFELSPSVEQILQNVESLMKTWGEVCYDEARLLEEEEHLLRRLAKRCGLNLPSFQTQSQSLRMGTKYLSADNQTQARPLLWDGVPLTAALLWERARKAKRQRVHGYGTSPTYARSDDSFPPLAGVSSSTPPFLARRRSGASIASDYPAHHVPPMRLHPSVPFTKELPRSHTKPVELPDLTIRTCIVPWSDIAREFVPLKTPIDGTPILRDDAVDVFTFGADARSEDGSRSEDTNEGTSIPPALKRQKSEVLAPTFRVVTDAGVTTGEETKEPAEPATSDAPSNRRIAGGYRIAVASCEEGASGTDSDSEEDISDEAVAARHEVVLQRMRDRFKKLQELKNKQQEQLTIAAPQGANPSSAVTSPKKGRKGKAKSSRSHGRSHTKAATAASRGNVPPPPKPDAFSMPFTATTTALDQSAVTFAESTSVTAPVTVSTAAAIASTTTSSLAR